MTTPAVRVRFAPAPTGTLHVGGARTALFNYLYARKSGGTLVLRSEDTDTARSSADSETLIQDDLRWLGLDWDEGPDMGGPYAPYRQTDRRERYALAAARLIELEKAYPCFCTPEELDAERAAADAKGLPPRYSGKCRTLTAAERSAYDREGRKSALRFAMPDRDIYVEDLIRGSVHFPAGTIGDFVVVKSEGLPTYNLAAVVDDSEMAISHVIRGDEHLPNTPRQVALYEALGLPLPLFAHVSMILAPDHQKLSKRHGATAVAEYREQGYLPEALLNYIALLGWSPGDDREFFTLAELTEVFSLERVAKSPAVFDHGKLQWFNAHYVRRIPDDQRIALVAEWAGRDERIGALPEYHDPAWRALLDRTLTEHVHTLADIPREAAAIFDDTASMDAAMADALAPPAARAMLAELASIADAVHSDAAAWSAAVTRDALSALGVRHGIKGRALFRPIRAAVTGVEHGHELPLLLPLLGPSRVAARIRRALDGQDRPSSD
ncbi:MAG TPA: glutamate--tRNA ligase [Candidatus Eremiobacteraceae bacterium]|nr:glutamate--tRNA ligase [Candidatus Eremiobacteraceae bacterium]